MKLEVTSRHDHSCLLGRKASKQTNKQTFKADAIPSLPLLKSIWEGNLYFGPFETILRILESGIIFRFPLV